MMQTNTAILSFRAHKNLQSWLNTAAQTFIGHCPELLRLILERSAMEQLAQTPAGFIARIFGNGEKAGRALAIGGTKVFSIRISLSDLTLIKRAAAAKGIGVSEWAAQSVFSWYETFKQYQETHQQIPGWLTEYTRLYRAKFAEVQQVYAQKQAKEAEKDSQAHQVATIT
jgi:hypothetical protein